MTNGFRMPLGVVIVLLCVLTMLAIFFALLTGPVELSIQGWKLSEFQRLVLFEMRLPRLLLALFVGALLALCGAVMQGLFRNPLADPGIAGVSTGAALGAVVGFAFFPELSLSLIPFLAFSGGLVSTLLVWKLAQSPEGTSVVMLLLAGVAISAMGGAVMGYLSYVADDTTLRNISVWQMGSLSGATYPMLALCGCTLLVLSCVFQHFSIPLNAILLGEAEARHLGVDVEKLKLLLIVFCAIGVGVAVSASGIIGFVGLVVPHCVRLLMGPDHRTLLPLSMLLGAILLSFSDTVSRAWLSPAELPVGLVTALIGAPFFFFLLIQQRSRLRY